MFDNEYIDMIVATIVCSSPIVAYAIKFYG